MKEIKISNDEIFKAINLNENKSTFEHNEQIKLKISTENLDKELLENIKSKVILNDDTLDVKLTETSFKNNKSDLFMEKIVESPQALRSNPEQFYEDYNEDDFKPNTNINTNLKTESHKLTLMNDTKSNTTNVDINDEKLVIVNNQSLVSSVQLNTSSLNNKTESYSSSSRLRTVGTGIVQVKMQNTTVQRDGSTKLIYSVHLGGKPVPAETAAKDMALLSSQEVALELGAPVIIQSERKFFFLYIYTW